MGHIVRVTEDTIYGDVSFSDGMYRIPVYEAWSISSLLESSTVDMVDVDQMVQPRPNTIPGFTIHVSHDDIGVPLLVKETLYRTIVSSPSFLLRVSHDDTEGIPPMAARYVDRILVAVEHFHDKTPCGAFLIDERGTFSAYVGCVSVDALLPVSSVLMHADMFSVTSTSIVCLHLFMMLSSRWNVLLRCMWQVATQDTLLEWLRHASTPDCIARCIDPNVLIVKAMRNERINVLGMSLVRRMKCSDATRYADMRTSMITHHGVLRFDVLPIARSRFNHLHSIGVFDGMTACRSAVLIGLEECIMCVPVDTKTIHLTESVSSLLLGICTNMTGERPINTYVFGVLYQESASQCPVPESLISYRLTVDALSRTLRIEDSVEDGFDTEEIMCVDELERMTIPCDASRTRRQDVAVLFPEMAKRVELKSSQDTSACLREVQSRRVTHEWALDSIDAGQNMSSLGLTIMLYLLLSHWLGARCRIAQSRTGAALLAVYVGSRYHLIDPCRTLCNFFTLSREVSTFAEGGTSTPPIAGMVIEVCQNGQWHVGVVRTVEVERGSMIVQTAWKGMRVVVSIGTHGWRCVSRGGSSDLDRIMRPLILQRKRERENV
tara:strand:- start:27753 stop:29570 length:1818 start_codon:yes stop_codon:yes gene_type:complete